MVLHMLIHYTAKPSHTILPPFLPHKKDLNLLFKCNIEFNKKGKGGGEERGDGRKGQDWGEGHRITWWGWDWGWGWGFILRHQ